MTRQALAILVLAIPALALAESSADTITGVTPSSRATVTAYEAPSRSSPAMEVPKEQLLANPQVRAREKGFLQVDIGGRPLWVPMLQVRIRKDSHGSCSPKTASRHQEPQAQIATPGISGSACQ